MNTSRSLNTFLKRARLHPQFDPVRDWLIALTIAIVAFIAITAWNVWAFDVVAGGGTVGTVTSTTTPIFSQSSLDVVRTTFANRAAEEAKYVSGVYKYTDPSL
jgi:hypothetical protein